MLAVSFFGCIATFAMLWNQPARGCKINLLFERCWNCVCGATWCDASSCICIVLVMVMQQQMLLSRQGVRYVYGCCSCCVKHSLMLRHVPV
jgi:hypothetical protein